MKRTRHPEYQYLNLLQNVMQHGTDKPVFGAKTTIRSVFGRQMRFDLSQGFPLLTTKKVFMRGITYELLWFLRGDSNIKFLVDNNVHIWDEWAYKRYEQAISRRSSVVSNNKKQRKEAKDQRLKTNDPLLTMEQFVERIKKDAGFAKEWGELGNVYGVQWRRWPAGDGRTIDQLGWAINELRTTPFRKSIVVSAWNPEYIYEMASSRETSVALPPCHTLYQFSVANGRLSLQLYQRSADLFLGVPFNIASYALLTCMVAHVTGFEPGEFVHTFGDAHIYSNHFDQIKEQLTRSPRPFPTMKLNPGVKTIDDFTYTDFTLVGYDPYPPIKGEVTVVGGF